LRPETQAGRTDDLRQHAAERGTVEAPGDARTGDEYQHSGDDDEHDHRGHRDRSGRLAADQVVQREEIGGTGRADRRTDQDGKPVLGSCRTRWAHTASFDGRRSRFGG
jgi:hypothetical protein